MTAKINESWIDLDAAPMFIPPSHRDAMRQWIAGLAPNPTRLGAALHRAYCHENRPMHSHPIHSADAIIDHYRSLSKNDSR